MGAATYNFRIRLSVFVCSTPDKSAHALHGLDDIVHIVCNLINRRTDMFQTVSNVR